MVIIVNVGITGVGGPAGVVCIKALEDRGLSLVGMDANPLSAGFKLVKKSYVVPYARDIQFIPKVLEISNREKIDILIPTVDEELVVLSENKDKFSAVGTKVAASGRDSIENCLDKWVFYKEVKRLDIPTPETWLPEDVENVKHLEMPVLVKPRIGRGGRGVFFCETQEELNAALKKSENVIIQEYVDGKEYTIDTLSDFEGNPIVAVCRERIEIKGGISWKGVIEDVPLLKKVVLKLVKGLGIRGPACTQAKVDKNGQPKIFEVNPRVGGTTSLTIRSGVNIPYLTVKMLLGEEIERKELKHKKLFITRYFEDVYFEPEELEDI